MDRMGCDAFVLGGVSISVATLNQFNRMVAEY